MPIKITQKLKKIHYQKIEGGKIKVTSFILLDRPSRYFFIPAK